MFRSRSAAKPAAAGAVLAAGLLMCACSMPLTDAPLLGLPENIPPRPETPAAYLPVHDMPAPRSAPVLTPEEQARIEKELAAARDRQNAKTNAQRSAE
ncbi:MAG: hypothetical protein EKK40_17185 [Bradyrhizobiaceae bacterium]|nr:MAG: hypothetical protein EKK40_17185 [Bradyrhizobiaceae bacterium]